MPTPLAKPNSCAEGFALWAKRIRTVSDEVVRLKMEHARFKALEEASLEVIPSGAGHLIREMKVFNEKQPPLLKSKLLEICF